MYCMHASKHSSVDSVERKTCSKVKRGPQIPISTPYGGQQAATIEEFKKRPIEVGCFVFTRQAQHSRAAQECAKLSEMEFWLWKVLKIYEAGHSDIRDAIVAQSYCGHRLSRTLGAWHRV